MEDSTDGELIERYRAGDNDALGILIERHTKSVYNFVLRILGSTSAADDVTQETFVKMWRNLNSFRVGANLKTWLFTIARNTALDHIRRRRQLPFALFRNDDGSDRISDTLEDEGPDPEDDAILAEDKERLDQALALLSQNEREVLYLYYNGGLTFSEIGETIDKPLNTVKSIHRRALIALRKNIKKETW